MEKVYIVRWSYVGSMSAIHAVYLDYARAYREMLKLNKTRNWWHRLCGERYVIDTLPVVN